MRGASEDLGSVLSTSIDPGRKDNYLSIGLTYQGYENHEESDEDPTEVESVVSESECGSDIFEVTRTTT